MNTQRGRIYGGAFLITAGIASVAGQFVGYDKVWFLYPLTAGILMFLAPWAGEKVQSTRIAGVWVALTGLIGALVTFTDLTWGSLWPLYVLTAGLISVFLRTREAA